MAMEQKKTSDEVHAIVNAIALTVQAIVEAEGISEYVEGFAVVMNGEAMEGLIREEMTLAAADELTGEVETFLANL
jgi:hypothetical protein